MLLLPAAAASCYEDGDTCPRCGTLYEPASPTASHFRVDTFSPLGHLCAACWWLRDEHAQHLCRYCQQPRPAGWALTCGSTSCLESAAQEHPLLRPWPWQARR